MELTQARLKELLHYDPETGHFTWVVARKGCRLSRSAGYTRHDGYVCIRVDRQLYLAHRLAWIYMTGEWPANDLDHIGGDPTDNRWCNLRAATRAQNNLNTKRRSDNASGYKGVFWSTQKQRWVARIHIDGKPKHLGSFKVAEDAYAAYCEAAKASYGQFARAA